MSQSNILQYIDQNQLITYQQLFSIFDKDDIGMMPTTQIHLFIRGLGHCPTEAQLKQMTQRLDPNEQGMVSFVSIVQMLVKRKRQQSIQDQLLQAFQFIQNETGSHSDSQKSYKISVTGVKKYLSQFGQNLTEMELEQIQQFLDENNLKEGIQFNFRDMAKILAYGFTQ